VGRVSVALGAHKSNSFLGISPSPRARVRAFGKRRLSGTVVPDLRWLVGGGFVIVFLLVGWVRAALLG
jgi:hypothetical protein